MTNSIEPLLSLNNISEVNKLEYEKCLFKLSNKFRLNPLKFGYIGFNPFVTRKNGSADGPAIDLIYKLGNEMGLGKENIVAKQISWNDVENSLEKHEIDIVIDPIIEGRKVAIVGYSKIHTPFIVYKEEVALIVDECLNDISEILSMESGFSKQFKFYNTIRRLEKIKHGIGVTNGTIEHKIVDVILKLRIDKLFDSPDISENITEGVKLGMLMIADEPSFRKVEKTLDVRVKAKSIFPLDFNSTWISTGFAVPREDIDIQIFLAFESKFSHNKIIKTYLSKLNNDNKIKSLGIKINEKFETLEISQNPFVIENVINDIYFNNKFDNKELLEIKMNPSNQISNRNPKINFYSNLTNVIIIFVIMISLLVANIMIDLPKLISIAVWIAFIGLTFEIYILSPELLLRLFKKNG